LRTYHLLCQNVLCGLSFQLGLSGADEVAMEPEVCYNLSREVGVHL